MKYKEDRVKGRGRKVGYGKGVYCIKICRDFEDLI